MSEENKVYTQSGVRLTSIGDFIIPKEDIEGLDDIGAALASGKNLSINVKGESAARIQELMKDDQGKDISIGYTCSFFPANEL